MKTVYTFLFCTVLIGLAHCKSSNKQFENLLIDTLEQTVSEYLSRDAKFQFADIVSEINSMETTWKAEIPKRFMDHSEEELFRFIGCSKKDPDFKNLPQNPKTESEVFLFIPVQFDARANWPNCSDIIGLIRDQSNCGSCWAFGAAESMSDRICIKSMAATRVNISAEDINDCCRECGDGCEGGFPRSAWEYYQNPGVVTGGNFGSRSGCKPYSLASCDHHLPVSPHPCPSSIAKTPHCERKCSNPVYDKAYKIDLHKGMDPHRFEGVENIMTEIMKNGPVEASFSVYADFPTYKSGVYEHKTGKFLGGHAVKILGWGMENNMPYWLVANSWNADWGDKGYFKIVRGKNECGIEGGIVASIPI